jgi:hypothetical protein
MTNENLLIEREQQQFLADGIVGGSVAKTRFEPDMINSAPTSVECDVCHARLATTTVVEFIRACGPCAKKIENLMQCRTQLRGQVATFARSPVKTKSRAPSQV